MKKNCPLLTEFDQITLGNSTQIMKAVLPFLDFKTQKMLSMFIRIRELIATVEFYRSNAAVAFSREHSGGLTQSDLLCALKTYCPDMNLDMIDNFNNFMQMENIMSAFQDMANMSEFNNMFNAAGGQNSAAEPDADGNKEEANAGEGSHNDAYTPSHEEDGTECDHKKQQSNSPNSGFNFMENMMNPQQRQTYEELLKDLENMNFESEEDL